MKQIFFSKDRWRGRLTAAAALGFTVSAVWFLCAFWKVEAEYRRGAEDMERVYEIIEEIENGEQHRTVPSAEERGQFNDGENQTDRQVSADRQAACRKLEAVNLDTVSWIEIPKTPISYPVMHTPGAPDFYLDHGFDKRPSACGMIYLDAGCDLAASGNLLVYGHHMKNGSMFASLVKYEGEDYRDEHSMIRLDTLEETRQFEIFAVVRVSAEEMTDEVLKMMMVENEETYGAFAAWLEEHRLYDTGVRPQWPEKLITLMTCEYSLENGRFMVVGREVCPL